MKRWSSWLIPLIYSGIAGAQPLHDGENLGALKIGYGLSSISLDGLNQSLLEVGFSGLEEQGRCLRLELQVVEAQGLTFDGSIGVTTVNSRETANKRAEMASLAVDALFGFEIFEFSEHTSLYPKLGPGICLTDAMLHDGSEEAGTWQRTDLMLIGGLNSFHVFGAGPGCVVIGLSGEIGWRLTSGRWDAKDPKVDFDPALPGMFVRITASVGYGIFGWGQ